MMNRKKILSIDLAMDDWIWDVLYKKNMFFLWPFSKYFCKLSQRLQTTFKVNTFLL